MKYAILNEITDVIYTNIGETDFPIYSAATAYNKGDKVTVIADKKNYYCTAATAITGKTPSIYTDYWVASPMNKWAIFDNNNSARTKNYELIEYHFNVQNIDVISFLKLNAKSIEMRLVDNTTGAEVWNHYADLVVDDLADFGDYLFSEQELSDKLTSFVPPETLDAVIASMTNEEILTRFTANPPIYYDARLEIKINKPAADVSCRSILVGRQRELGISIIDGATVGIIPYSVITRDPNWGTVDFIERDSASEMSIPVYIEDAKVTTDIIYSRLEKANGKPLLFIADESGKINSATVFGFFRDFTLPLNPTSTVYTLEIEGLV